MTPSALGMLQNASYSIPAVEDLILSVAYVLGIIFIGNALYQFRNIGDHRSMTSSPTDLKGPLGSLIVGTMLIYLPGIFTAVTYTMWSSDPGGMMAYTPSSSSSSEFVEIVNITFEVMQLIGIIAFIRGWIILAKLGDHGNQGGFAKALSHIIGGVLAYHLDATIYVFQATFGFA